MQSNYFTSRQDFDEQQSSYMHSQAGSPSRRARRTREERKKTVQRLDTNESMCDDYSTNGHANCDDSMLNISPLRKTKTNVKVPILALHTPARCDIDEFLMHENLIASASKGQDEERIFTEQASLQIDTSTAAE